ncbi:P-loop containing nucleoside triphosphate hydrolase protein [Mycena pura]|uniref:P-loop containing nucleoside triphosphate hydrolase protein n=1 Tax=Mycena pura TaxID=153505 RepID=A0AAD6UPF0_9AGAR|nr:P-loop containing nucleoside triphosphate hydrolase protein [Mycena pura]
MPSLPSANQIRLNSITACLKAAVDTVNTLANNLGFSFFNPISATIESLTKLMEEKPGGASCNHYYLCRLRYSGDLEPKTLHKIHTFVEAQQGGNRIKILLRRSEMNTLLKDCKIGLQNAFDVFKVNTAILSKDINEMQKNAVEKHQEVLDLIASLSDTTDSETTSSLLSRVLSSSFSSSTSLSMLPSMPQIFHGRESELSDILQLFNQGAPRIAILGAGGMGKTSLARAVLHHPEIIHMYGECRIFVACDVALTMPELVALIVNYLGLKLGKNPTQQIIHHIESRPRILLILDNLETAWELPGSRKEIEEFLALLTDIEHLALIITMRGAERPAQVHWTRPFLKPLSPLAYDAAQKTFIDIAGENHDTNEMDKILHLTDNMPLAIDLMAHLVDSEGCATVLSHWDTERTSLVSDGYDRRSNLDMSIALSLSSPRVASVSGTHGLLSLLSMLPDGISDLELRKSNLPTHNILECKATLLRTSLAYISSQKRLKVLVPVQEHMQRHHPAQLLIIQPLFQHYRELLELYLKFDGTMWAEVVPRITMNFANIQSLLSFRLHQEQLDHSQTIYSALNLHSFSLQTGISTVFPLMDLVAASLPVPVDHVHFLSHVIHATHLRKDPRLNTCHFHISPVITGPMGGGTPQ